MRNIQTLQVAVYIVCTLLLSSITVLANPDGITFYVSPEGNDSWSGEELDKPFSDPILVTSSGNIQLLKFIKFNMILVYADHFTSVNSRSDKGAFQFSDISGPGMIY